MAYSMISYSRCNFSKIMLVGVKKDDERRKLDKNEWIVPIFEAQTHFLMSKIFPDIKKRIL